MATNNTGLLCFFFTTLLIANSKFEGLFDMNCEHIRRNVTCQQVECHDGKLVEGGSLCGACPICVTYLDENKPCGLDPAPPGGVPKSTCRPGLECRGWSKKICQKKDLHGCLQDKEHRRELIETQELFEGAWIPNCKGEEYEAKQCKGQKCFCYGKNGERLFGQAERHLAENMTCSCSVALFHVQSTTGTAWMTEPHEHCTLDGNYEELQCAGKVCFCANPVTGMHKGLVTHIDYLMLLPCYDASQRRKFYLTECESIVQRSRLLAHQFSQKGIKITGLDEVTCDFDGSFGRTQCLPDSCICTDRNGNKYKSYGIARYHLKDVSSMLCNCARDEYDRDVNGAQFSKFQCTSEGNYAFHQTIDKEDMCVDEDGEILAFVEGAKQLAVECLNKRNLAAGIVIDDYSYEYD